jgi:FKBP-type peptidyl-prolyl cis-trans isomerase 2
MNPSYFIWFIPTIMLIIIILAERRKKFLAALQMVRAKRLKTKGDEQMKGLAEKFVGKECIIYTINHQISGTIKEVGDGALLVDVNGNLEALNLDFITRIREYPRNKNGKKKSVILD